MYSGKDDPKAWVLARAIAEQAAARGSKTAVSVIDGASLTYAELASEAATVAGFLAGLGLKSGDRIAVLVPNCLDFVRVWAGIERLGATCVFLNTELIGSFLLHPLRDAEPHALIVDVSLIAQLEGLGADRPIFDLTIVVGNRTQEHDCGIPFDQWREASPFDGPFPRSTDIAAIMYTSGTTGPPKGVMMPHAHCFLFGLGNVERVGITGADHYYICLPLFHANALLIQLGSVLIAGGSATITSRFSASTWLDDVRRCKATVTNTLGVIAAYLAAQPPTQFDRDHNLRLVSTAPNHPDHDKLWRDRFGITDVASGFGMTECNIPLIADLEDPRPGGCGKVWSKYFEVQIHDPNTGLQVPTGEIGEIVVRPRIGQAFMSGYYGQPAKTVDAWRGLWFHTGDAGRLDEDAQFTFVDRIKDCIRRRGGKRLGGKN